MCISKVWSKLTEVNVFIWILEIALWKHFSTFTAMSDKWKLKNIMYWIMGNQSLYIVAMYCRDYLVNVSTDGMNTRFWSLLRFDKTEAIRVSLD